ncbi:hypothetical protein M409DRAFT_29254 [Zasmidium cellare ATCC 36951]|uniref:Coagulation factor 5/8 type domain-containing protein n=1 Tax=Zasmidium cellare ATCC 36951 TaxID=1080233 RepID=A0A6A6C2A9_ZASCE|nr:uncharacterized protein M409DRAFT_29254 [Zasmidium cellare ATCC 36951]KAF2160408.1 hypothetical protein M409DRAFT_29254 [Zasmidium cellare ATCC 36951]
MVSFRSLNGLAKAALFSTLFYTTSFAQDSNVKIIYLFEDPALSNNTAIKTSGFNTAVVFALNIQDNGDLVYPLSALGGGSPDVTLVSNGSYVGGTKYADLIKGYKTGDTQITRTEATVGPATLIQSMINANGTDPSTLLYKNLATLKAAWNLDGINNDDESLYDVPSTVSFAKMLGQIGYKYSGAPYTNIPFWQSVVSQVNGNVSGLLDRMYLQCYDGGAGNDPGEWQTDLNMKVVPLLWVVNDAKPEYGMTPAQCQAKFQNWYSTEQVAGGGYWNDYDIEKQNSSYTAYGDALDAVFG